MALIIQFSFAYRVRLVVSTPFHILFNPYSLFISKDSYNDLTMKRIKIIAVWVLVLAIGLLVIYWIGDGLKILEERRIQRTAELYFEEHNNEISYDEAEVKVQEVLQIYQIVKDDEVDEREAR